MNNDITVISLFISFQFKHVVCYCNIALLLYTKLIFYNFPFAVLPAVLRSGPVLEKLPRKFREAVKPVETPIKPLKRRYLSPVVRNNSIKI